MVHRPKRYNRPSSRGIWFLPKTVEKLASTSSVQSHVLESVLSRAIDPYVEFQMKKRSGGFRTIAVPTSNFKPTLNYLLSTFSSEFIHDAAWAYVPGKSVVNCARIHEGMTWGIKVDLKNFFASVDEDKVYLALTKSGFSWEGSRLVARLTTRLKLGSGDPFVRTLKRPYPFRKRSKRTKVRAVGHLPQGSPTSGYLSNLVAWDLDCSLSALAESAGMKYTRYSDDILLSSASLEFNRKEALSLLASIRKRCNSYGFELNQKKTRILTPGSRKQYLGLLLDAPGVRLTSEKKKAIETTMWALEKYGVTNHAAHLGFRVSELEESVTDSRGDLFFNRFWGQVAYVMDVDKKLAISLLSRIIELGKRDAYLRDSEQGQQIIVSAQKLLTQRS